MDDGSAILGHVVGNKRSGFEKNISSSSGLNAETTTQLLSMLTPVILGVLGQMQHKQSMEPQDVASLLQNERKTAESAVPGMGGGAGPPPVSSIWTATVTSPKRSFPSGRTC